MPDAIRVVSRTLAVGAVAAALVAAAACAAGGVGNARTQCEAYVLHAPHVVSYTPDHANDVVTATLYLGCDSPPPIRHAASFWLATRRGDAWVPAGGVKRSNRIPSAHGFDLTASAPCRHVAEATETWRAYAAVRGVGPRSPAAPDGIPFDVKLTSARDTAETALPCAA